jgi:two-component system, sensor histidine kinase PdtaS
MLPITRTLLNPFYVNDAVMKNTFISGAMFFIFCVATAQEKKELFSREDTSGTAYIIELINKAKEIGKKDTVAADKIFRSAIAKAINTNDNYNAGIAYSEMGEMYFHHKNHNKSFGGFLNAKDFFVKNGSEKEIAITNFKLGRQQYYRGNYKISSGHLSFAMHLAKQLKLKKLESDILEYMGILYHAMPVPEYQSSNLLNKSLEIKQQLKDQNGELHILKKLGGVYYDQKKFDSSLYCSNASVALAEKLNLKYDANLSRLDQIPALLRLNNYAEAKEKLSHVKINKFASSDLNMSIRYYIQEGNYHVALQDTAAAGKKYDTALHIAQNSGFPELSALVYQHMAGAYYYKNDFKKAYEYQLQYGNKMASLYSYENLAPFKQLESFLKTNSTEDEVKYLNVQNEIKEVRLRNEKALRFILLTSATGLLLSAAIIFLLYRRQKRKNRIIEKQGVELQTLMKEIHHRVKNNLQVISSLLDLQALSIKDKEASEAVREGKNRVQSMALIHQNLYNDGNVRGIAMEGYINNLAQHLFDSYNIKPEKIKLVMDIESLSLDVDTAIPIGLVLNELISNSLKYAFINREEGEIWVQLKQQESSLFLQVKDNGNGFPPLNEAPLPPSFGMKLLRAFAQKLKAKLDIYNDHGACVSMRIDRFKLA